MRPKKRAKKSPRPKLVIHGVQHYQVRIKPDTPIQSRTWQSVGVLPQGKIGTVTGVVQHMAGIEGFLRVIWDGYADQPTLVNPTHVERIEEKEAEDAVLSPGSAVVQPA